MRRRLPLLLRLLVLATFCALPVWVWFGFVSPPTAGYDSNGSCVGPCCLIVFPGSVDLYCTARPWP